MRSHFYSRLLIIVAIVLVLIATLVIVQSQTHSKVITQQGRLTVTGTLGRNAAPDFEALTLNYPGFGAEISQAHPARFFDAAGASTESYTTRYEESESAITVIIDERVRLLVSARKDPPESLTLSALLPKGISRLEIYVSAPAVHKDENWYTGYFTLSSRAARIDSAGKILAFDASPTASTITLSPKNLAAIAPAQPVSKQVEFSDQREDPALVAAVISAWRDKVWSGLSSGRFDPAAITWRNSDGSYSFTEEALAAYVAEALVRGVDVRSVLLSASEHWPDQLGMLTMPYNGKARDTTRAREKTDAAETQRLAALIAAKSAAVLEKHELFRFALNHAPQAFFDSLSQFALTLSPHDLTPTQLAGLVAFLFDAENTLPASRAPIGNLSECISTLMGLFVETANGPFVQGQDGFFDLADNAWIGKLLVSIGTKNGEASLVNAGQTLLKGILGLTDSQGWIPAKIRKIAGGVERIGQLAPEIAYPLIAANPWYPHEISLYRELGRSAYLWTSGDVALTFVKANQIILTIKYPLMATHFSVLKGLGNPTLVTSNAQSLADNPGFESSAETAFTYDASSRSIFLRLSQVRTNELIEFDF